jgi:hypothetical protein
LRLSFDPDISSVPGAVSSAVEHYVDIVGVTGSIPVLPTMIFQVCSTIWKISLLPFSA